LTRGALFTRATGARTRFTRVATGAFGTACFCFGPTTTRITSRTPTDVGKSIFKTFFARFCSSHVLKITRIAIQTKDSTITIHVLTGNAIQTCCLASQVLVLPCVTFQAFL
jgi:hypothetical protein